MATEQHDKNYGSRTMVRVAVLMMALMGLGLLILPVIEHGPKASTAGYVLITLWILVLLAGSIWAGRVRSRYRCPKCGTHLPLLKPEAATKYQHRFYCRTCDVVWTTDVYVGD